MFEWDELPKYKCCWPHRRDEGLNLCTPEEISRVWENASMGGWAGYRPGHEQYVYVEWEE